MCLRENLILYAITQRAFSQLYIEAQNPWIDEFCEVHVRCTADFKAPKLGKGSSGRAFGFRHAGEFGIEGGRHIGDGAEDLKYVHKVLQ